MSNIKKYKVKQQETGPLSINTDSIPRSSLTDGQKEAEKIFDKWFTSKKKQRKPILRIGGVSGSGKSWFIRYLIEKYGWERDECYLVSYTGQSMNVLRSRGLMATTIHSAFMIPVDEPILDSDGRPIYKRGIPMTALRFRPVSRIPSTVQLIIVDEASFLPESLEKTLLRYNVPILEIGDPVQLPPVGGKQCFHMGNLDHFMTGVMRQNADSDIYKLSMCFREGRSVDLDQYWKDVWFVKQQETIEDTFYRFLPILRGVDIIITSTNKQRQIITDLYRQEIIGTNSPYPVEGERVICRRNNRAQALGEFMLTNGTQGVCLNTVGRSMVDKSTRTFCMDFMPDVTASSGLYYDNLICDADFIKQPFGSDLNDNYKHLGDKFEYAHAITTHLMQGGQARTVFFFDSFSRDLEYLNRVRYTAVTRATWKLYYAIPYNGEWSLTGR